MKKLSLLLFVFILAFASCKKKDKESTTPQATPKTYEEKLEGEWNLVAVSYATEIPDIVGGGAPIQIAGNGTEVSGDFDLTRNPNRVVYDLSFKAEADPFNTGTPTEIPVNFASAGDWTTTSDASKVIVTDDLNQEIIFNVEVNEDNKQVFSATIMETINMGLPITLAVDVVLSFERDN